MEKQTKITIACFMAILLCSVAFVVQPSYAQAFQALTGFTYPIVAMEYQSTTDLIWVLTQNTTNQKSFLYWIDRPTKSIVGSSNLTAIIETQVGTTQRVHDIGCGKTDCFVTTGNGGVTGYIIKIPSFDIAPNIFQGQNATGSFVNPVAGAPFWHIYVEDNVVTGFGTIRLYVGTCSEAEATCDHMVRVINGVSMTDTGIFTIFAVTNNAGVREHDFILAGNSAVAESRFIMVRGHANLDTGSQNDVFIYDTEMVAGCSVQPTPPIQTTPLGVTTRFVDYGHANNKVYVSGVDGTMFVYDYSCNLIQSLTSNDTGVTGDIRYIDYSSGRLFYGESGGTARIGQLLVNSTGHIITTGDPSLYFPQPSVSQSTYDATFVNRNVGHQLINLGGNGEVWYPYTGTDKRVGILTFDAELGGGGDNMVCVDVNFDGIVDVCYDDVNGDGVPDASPLEIIRGGQNVTESANNIACQIGIETACDNPDPKTNGIGYLLVIILLAFMIVMFALARLKTSLIIPEWLWIIGTLAVLGASIFLGWIDTTLFILATIVIVAMAGFKIVAQFAGSDF